MSGIDNQSTTAAQKVYVNVLQLETGGVGTRGTDPLLQNNVFDERTQIGLFVVRPEIWKYISDAAANDDTAPSFCDEPYNGYGYMNVKCHVKNGCLITDDGFQLDIPTDSLKDSLGIAVMAYAPYKQGLKLRNFLRRHGGTNLHLRGNQSLDEDELNSDVMLGVPEDGNPIWRLSLYSPDSVESETYRVSADTIYVRHPYRVKMNFKHNATRINLAAQLYNTSKTDTLRYDSIRVSLVDPALIYRYGPYLDNTSSAFVYPDGPNPEDLNTNNVVMAKWSGLSLLPDQCSASYKATCIVLPIQLHETTTFLFEFYRDGTKILEKSGGALETVKYEAGKSVSFECKVNL